MCCAVMERYPSAAPTATPRSSSSRSSHPSRKNSSQSEEGGRLGGVHLSPLLTAECGGPIPPPCIFTSDETPLGLTRKPRPAVADRQTTRPVTDRAKRKPGTETNSPQPRLALDPRATRASRVVCLSAGFWLCVCGRGHSGIWTSCPCRKVWMKRGEKGRRRTGECCERVRVMAAVTFVTEQQSPRNKAIHFQYLVPAMRTSYKSPIFQDKRTLPTAAHLLVYTASSSLSSPSNSPSSSSATA